GWNYFGQLGSGGHDQHAELERVRGLPPIDDIALGQGHACALARDSTVWCWGLNYLGQLGDGTTIDRSVPAQVHGLDGVVAIAVGVHVSCALRDEELFCWGDSHFGQMRGPEDHVTTPKRVSLALGGERTFFGDERPDRVVALRAGGATICA